MQEEIESEEELSLSEIFRALKAKIWVLLVTLIIGIAAGGGFGFLRYYNVHYYGADVTYLIFASDVKKEDSKESASNGGTASIQTTAADEGASDDSAENGGTSNDSAGDLDLLAGQGTTILNESALTLVKGFIESNKFQRMLMDGLPEAEDIQPDTLEEQKFFRLLDESVTYSYTVGQNKITATVSVLNDSALASHLFERIKTILPEVISTLLTSSDKNVACTQLSYQLCRLLNPNQWVTEGIKYGALIGLATLVVACVAVVIAERADTRLHDYEKVAQKFNVPVLGVIPRISDIEHTHIQRNKTEGKK